MGSSVSVSELVSATGLFYGGKKTFELLRFREEERPLGLQLFGENVDHLCRGAQALEPLKPDFIDLNLGCPVPKVVKRGAGAAMCRDTVALGQTLEAVVRSVKLPVTIKIRSGWDEGSRNAVEVVRVAAASGVAWVAVHARTRAQGYSGEADWNLIGEVKAKSTIPIIGNGDLITPEVAVRRLREFGVDAVMIGRGVLRNPFLLQQSAALWRGEVVQEPSAQQYVELVENLSRRFHEHFSEHQAMIFARKFLSWFASGFPGCHEFRRKVFHIPEDALLWEEARRFFAEATAGRDTRHLSEPFLTGGHG